MELVEPMTEPSATDLSPQAVRVGRILDRLPVGSEYMLRVIKADLRPQSWQVEVIRVETIRRLEPRDV